MVTMLSLREPRALSSTLASLGMLQPRVFGSLKCIETLDSVSNYYKTGPSNPKCSRMTDGGTRQPEVTSPPKFSALLKELLSEVSADWEDIGLALDLEQGQLSAIRNDHRESNRCFREMLKLWLKQVEPPPTWSAIIEAIRILQYESLAEVLRKKYCE